MKADVPLPAAFVVRKAIWRVVAGLIAAWILSRILRKYGSLFQLNCTVHAC